VETSLTVINTLLKGKKAERVGLMDNPWPETVLAWVQQGYPVRKVHKEVGWQRWRREDGRWVKAEEAGEYEEPVPVWEHFDYDLVCVGGWFDIMPLRGYDELMTETDEWEVRRNGGGAALKYWKHKSGTPEHINFLMSSREIWENDYRPHLLEWDVERLPPLDETRVAIGEATAAKKWTYYGHVFIWENMRQMMGDVTLYESLLLDPEWIHDYNRVYTDLYKRYYTYLFDQVGKPDGIWMYEDLGYKNGLFASPTLLRTLIFPYYRVMVDFFHSHDLPVLLHTCGSTAQAMPLIVEAGFDALHPMERKALGNDPFLFAEQYGDRLVFIGGLDVRVFETNDRDLIRREVIHYIDGMKARGARLVFASDHSIPPTVSYTTYKYIVDVYRERMMY
jgi:uroporphyrinogen decarboxylase